MGWPIMCTDRHCRRESGATDIVDLISNYRDKDGWFLCGCGRRGYIEKRFELQEPDKVWEPFLRGIVPLGRRTATYQPFVFLVSYSPTGPANDVWFSYYKDLRRSGGRLKLGHGPGGPPVLDKRALLKLIGRLVDAGTLTRGELALATARGTRSALTTRSSGPARHAR